MGTVSPFFFTTGPIENAYFNSTEVLALKFLNDSNSPISVRAQVYGLNGGKDLLFDTGVINLDSCESTFNFVNFEAEGIPVPAQFEVVFISSIKSGALFSVWGYHIDENDNLISNPEHRVLHSELTKLRNICEPG
ncbi:hypothetical protein [Alteribacter keqinensis]|uniref:Uncharacterized protein n=1 Tax=Alteribacter keqinensis TaxID=2483800 RepID=A0A3M7TN18_9BACI|nr:hypothetical protein [Alteribacter keqinensis]RNA66778.1 hypothetical protein EBO34_16340 [Alteribacter keqinensis]